VSATGAVRHARLVIVGSGFAGLGAAIRLRQAGIDDFLILERAGSLGGVWRDNVYPGVAVDVESHLYQYSFAPNPGWTERYAPGAEIWEYLERCATEFGVRPHLRFGVEVREARWDAAAAQWVLDTSEGGWTAPVLVSAVGALSAPNLPPIPGLDRFAGPVFHSARWDRQADLRGKRVAVIGTGASAVQIIPAIQPAVDRLVVFQRTAGWVIPRHNRPIGPGARRLFRRFPAAERLLRSRIRLWREMQGMGFRHPWMMRLLQGIGRRHLRRSVRDPALRAALTPAFTIGCKRILISDDYYPALTQPNVTLVAGAAAEVRPHGVVGPGGVEHAADAIVLCTGFEVADFPFSRQVLGRDGRTLAEHWEGSPKAHLGTTVHGFPNFFILQGPNTGLGHTSVLLMQEAQFEHLVNALRYMDRQGVATVEPTEAAQRAFVAQVDRRLQRTIWMQGGCRSWYLDSTGRASALWPGTPGQFHRRVAAFRPGEYLSGRFAPAPAAPTRTTVAHA
jgi:cation diffusion facilitator CzcD-associated flavoprotein CzcO